MAVGLSGLGGVEKGKKMEKPRCKSCNSTQIYLRGREVKEKVCRTCGNIETIKKEGKNEGEKDK